MKNRHFCVICMLLPVIFLCTFLAGCGKEPQADPADVPFLSQVCTQDLEALPHTMEVRWQSGDLELLDATEGEDCRQADAGGSEQRSPDFKQRG